MKRVVEVWQAVVFSVEVAVNSCSTLKVFSVGNLGLLDN
jgi:hypothetical protein